MAKLNALKVKHLKKPGRYQDGDGLMLFIGKDGSRRWVLRIQVDGRRRDIGLGSAKDISLSDAREDAGAMRRAFKRGRDPLEERRKEKETIPTFKEAAKAVHAEHAPTWKNAKHASQWLATLERYAFPKLGDLPVNKIDGPMVRDVLAEIWLTIPETARRVQQRIGTVLDHCYSKGWRDAEAPMRSVARGLPKQPKRGRHFEAMPWQDVPDFFENMGDLLKTEETTRQLLEFTILTATRSGESRGARWREIDRKAKTWTIPAERMKGRRMHRVPLPARAMEIIEQLHDERRNTDPDKLIFEGRTLDKPLSDMSMTMPLRRAGLSVTVHGFRSSFRDWAEEATGFPSTLAEKALAHAVRDKTEAAYQRGDLFEKRRKLMEAWASYCTGASGKVVKLMKRRRA